MESVGMRGRRIQLGWRRLSGHRLGFPRACPEMALGGVIAVFEPGGRTYGGGCCVWGTGCWFVG